MPTRPPCCCPPPPSCSSRSESFTALLVAIAPVLAIVAAILSLAATTLFTGMVVELVADVQDGRRDATVGQLLRAATPVLGQLILVGIVAGIGVAIGFVLIIIPGLILITIWSVAAPVVVLENPGGLRALGRSRELVRGNGWSVFGVIFVLVIGVGIVAAIIEAIGDSGGTGVGIVVRVIVQILTAPAGGAGGLRALLRATPTRRRRDPWRDVFAAAARRSLGRSVAARHRLSSDGPT